MISNRRPWQPQRNKIKPRVTTTPSSDTLFEDDLSPEEIEIEEAEFQACVRRAEDSLKDSPEARAGLPAKIVGNPHFCFVGTVSGGHFHVFDSMSGAISYRELTGEKPPYRPIALSKVKEICAEQNQTLIYLDTAAPPHGKLPL